MDQAVSLTMSDKTAPPTREATPVPADARTQGADGASAAKPTSADGTAAATASSGVQDHGLYSGSFEEEVGQVVKSLGSFWGGFKARSASTLTSLKSDLDKTVAQLETDLKQLQDTKVEVSSKTEEEWEAEQAAELEKAKAAKEAAAAEAATKAKGKEREEPTSPTLLSRIQLQSTTLGSQFTSSTAQLQATLQSTLSSTLAKAKANPALDPTQIRNQLAENLRLSSAKENLTLSFQQAEKLAEEYLKKGGNLVRDAEAAAEKWVAENVQVVSPDTFIPMGNGDLYMFSTSASAPPPTSTDTPRASLSVSALAGSRKEALLARLREDEALLLHDPAGETETQQRRDEFALWIADKWPEVSRKEEEEHIGAIRMALVPEHLTDEVFWQRYLFHRDMIEAADAKRKELLEAAAGDDEFNWDEGDDEAEPAVTDSAQSATPTASVPAIAEIKEKDKASTPATSPRDSEESYDVVRTSTAAPSAAHTEDSDSDSDWE